MIDTALEFYNIPDWDSAVVPMRDCVVFCRCYRFLGFHLDRALLAVVDKLQEGPIVAEVALCPLEELVILCM